MTNPPADALEFSLDVHLFDHAMTTPAAGRYARQIEELPPRARARFLVALQAALLSNLHPDTTATAMRLIILESFFAEVRGSTDSHARAFLADFRDAAMREPRHRHVIAAQRAAAGDHFWSRPVPASTLSIVVDLAPLHDGGDDLRRSGGEH